jgi:hypothetical protein
MTLKEFQRQRAALGTHHLVICQQCGDLGELGCPHVVDDFVAAPVRYAISRTGCLRVETGASVSIPIRARTGLLVRGW